MTTRITLILLVLALASLTNVTGFLYTGTYQVNSVWPAQVIFGFYFVILVLCVQGLQPDVRTRGQPAALQRLFLLVLICLCTDLVSVNYREATKNEPAYYSLIVLWDLAVFFLWLRAVDLAKGATPVTFFSSPLIAVAPFLKLGREILLIPYSHWSLNPCSEDTISPYADLLFGDLAVCCWGLVALSKTIRLGEGSKGEWIERVGVRIVFFGCVFWALRAIENLLGFVAPNLVDAECKQLGIREYYFPVAYAVVSLLAVAVIARTNFLHIGTFFSVSRVPSRAGAL